MVTAAPAAAVFAFGGLYGSVAEPVMGAGTTIVSSVLIFSGAVQFAMVALLVSGAGVGALLAGAAVLNLRNLVLGALLRPRIDRGRLRRAGLAWFVVDESAGLALTAGAEAERTLLTSGAVFYVAWQAGTMVGVVGASFGGFASTAEAIFPVLFIGLAALSCSSRSVAARAVVAAAITVGGTMLWPEASGVVAVLAALLVALPGAQQ